MALQQSIPGLHLIGEYGEALMRRYLEGHGVPFIREPDLEPLTKRKIDFGVYASDGSRVLIEVKTIWQEPPRGFGYFNPFPPIRRHIRDAARQFSNLPETINVIALAVFPGSFVDIRSPHVMLSAMYGDMAFSFPFDTRTGAGDASSGQWMFVPGKGEIVQKEGETARPRKSRIAGLLSLHASAPFWPKFSGREQVPFAEVARQAIEQASDRSAQKPLPYVTVWENTGAKARIPIELFTGPMDMRWGVKGRQQCPTFTGEERAKQTSPR